MTNQPVEEGHRSIRGRDRGRHKLLFAVKLALSLSLLAFLLLQLDLFSVRAAFRSLDLKLLAVAVCLLLFQSLLSSLKWKLLLSADGERQPYVFLLTTYLIGNFFSLFLPTSFGGDVYRVLAVRNAGSSTVKTTSSVLFDRITGLVALVTLAFIGYLLHFRATALWLVVVGYAGFIGLFLIAISGMLSPGRSSVNRRYLRRILEIFDSFAVYARDRPTLIAALLISFAFQFNIVVINAFYAAAVGLDVTFVSLLAIIPLVYLTEVLPISVNGLGVRESAFVFFYVLIGQTAEAGFAVSLIVLTMRYGTGLIGGILYFVRVVRARPTPSGNVL